MAATGAGAAAIPALVTARLELVPLEAADAAFVLELLNEPGFMRFVGDKGVRSEADAVGYLDVGPLASYRQFGHGLLKVSRRDSGEPLGMCGLVRRDGFTAPDLGFAFLERHWSQGYASEASRAVLEDACARLGLDRIIAMADAGNAASARVLRKLGFVRNGTARLPGEDTDVELYERLEAVPPGTGRSAP